MKAPDKIYLPNGKEAVQNGLYKTWFDTDEHDMPYAEYIRKEALLEWLEGQLETLKPLLDTDPYKEAYIGKCEAFKEVINKLNEM